MTTATMGVSARSMRTFKYETRYSFLMYPPLPFTQRSFPVAGRHIPTTFTIFNHVYPTERD